MVGPRGLGAEHAAEEDEDGGVVGGVGGVGGDDCGEEVGVGGWVVVEDEACIGEVRESEGAEANKLEGVEVGVGMAESGEVTLKLLQMVQMIALAQCFQHMFVQVSLHLQFFLQTKNIKYLKNTSW